jgi:hypothetical protein
MKGRIGGLVVAVAALLLCALPAGPAKSADGYFCAGNSRPQVCVHQISGFGGEVREYGVTTGGPAGTGTEAYRVEILCGQGPLQLRVGETARGIGLGIGFIALPLIVPSVICPDVLPQLPI